MNIHNKPNIFSKLIVVAAEKLWYTFFLTIPLSVFGFNFNNYDFSFPVIILLFISVLGIIQGRFLKKFKILYLYLGYLVISCIALLIFNGINSFSSLILLFLLLIPIIIPIGSENPIKIRKYIIIGLYISFFLFIYELSTVILNTTNYIINTPLSLKQSISSNSFIPRVSGGFQEPSWFAYYLFSCFIYFKRSKLKENIHIIAIIVFTLLSTSLTGISLIIAYYIIEIVNQRKYKFVLIIAFVLPIIFLIGINNKYTEYYFTKVLKTYEAIGNLNANTSESVRVNALSLGVDYIKSNDNNLINLLFGEGYANQKQWIMNKYQGFDNEYGAGFITNLLVVTLISQGLIGLLLYIAMIYSLTNFYFNKSIFIVYLLFLNTNGYFIFILTWQLFYLGKFSTKDQLNEKKG